MYRDLDIVTGKDKQSIDVPIHGLDLIDVNKRFSSHEFVLFAQTKINEIVKRGNTPIIVGGTWLYIKHLLYGFDVETPPNPTLRAQLEPLTVSQLQNKLKEMQDQFSHFHIFTFSHLNDSDRHNPRRLIRRIEILTYYISHSGAETPVYDPPQPQVHFRSGVGDKIIGYRHADNGGLVKAIEERVTKRIEQGAVEEVEKLLAAGWSEHEPGMLTIGCAQIVQYLQGTVTKEQMIEQWTTREIQYAKRQYTFMKQCPDVVWRIK